MRSVFWRGAMLTVLLAAPLASCSALQTGPDDEVQTELNRQRRRWRAQSIDDYTYTVQRICFCLPDYTAPVRVRVRDGAVTERSYAERSGEVPAEDARFWPPVEGLFDLVQDAIDRDAHSIQVQYHPELGYPTSVQIDYDQMMADEELGMTASNLTRE